LTPDNRAETAYSTALSGQFPAKNQIGTWTRAWTGDSSPLQVPQNKGMQDAELECPACVSNAEALIYSAKEVCRPGSYHVAYHPAALALEEIGMLQVTSLRLDPKQEGKRPNDWIDDHERKLFWAVWFLKFDKGAPWQDIQQAIDVAKGVHYTRIESSYVDPANPGAQASFRKDDAENFEPRRDSTRNAEGHRASTADSGGKTRSRLGSSTPSTIRSSDQSSSPRSRSKRNRRGQDESLESLRVAHSH
jgi:AbiV family abortive infection protein